MSWRKRFLLWFGPSTLGGITFGDWLALLRENRFAVDPSYWLRATSITLCSLGNSLDRRREEASPFHTGRIRLLLDIFPEAKFVHIHRDPYAVFQLACHTEREALKYCTLQRHNLDVQEWTIRQYREIVEAFLAEKDLIPDGRFHDLRYADLERDPIAQMRTTYEALGLPDFREVEPSVRRYVASLGGYRKNVYPELAPATKARLRNEWERSFSAWGYPA
jgi:omega-hydroxy-beta-dihydromenaquinone-9 sulfotransferase